MIGRVLASVAILALLALNLVLPSLPIAKQGAERGRVRSDVAGAVVRVGEPMPDFVLAGLDGRPVRLSDLRGHRVLLTFERSLDW